MRWVWLALVVAGLAGPALALSRDERQALDADAAELARVVDEFATVSAQQRQLVRDDLRMIQETLQQEFDRINESADGLVRVLLTANDAAAETARWVEAAQEDHQAQALSRATAAARAQVTPPVKQAEAVRATATPEPGFRAVRTPVRVARAEPTADAQDLLEKAQSYVVGKKRKGPPEDMSPKQIYQVATAHFLQSNFTQAIEYFTILIRWYPRASQTTDALYWRGECFQRKKQHADAVIDFDAFIYRVSDHPLLAGALDRCARSLTALGREDEADVLRRRLLADHPRSTEARRLKRLQQEPAQ